MATTIKLKNGSGAPLAGDLVQGEPALDLTNKRLYTEDSGGTVIEVGTNPTSLTTGTFTSTGIDDNATSTAITIDASQRVGIGTSPSFALDVSVADTTLFRATNSGATGTFKVFHDSTLVSLGSVGGSTNELAFKTGGATGTEAIRIDQNQNVGIGTASPFGPLDVKAATDIHVGIDDSGSDALIYTATDAGQTAVVPLKFQGNSFKFNGSSEFMRIDSSGNVGIGTTSPQAKLDISGSFSSQLLLRNTVGDSTAKGGTVSSAHYTNAEEPQLLIGGYSDGTDNHTYVGGGFASGNNSTIISFHTAANDTTTGNSERMRIDSSGRVGIGTSSPSTELHVAGSQADGSVLFRLENEDTSITTNDLVGELQFYANDGSTNGTGVKANIKAVVENTPGNLIGLSFGTSDNTSATAVEAMRIDASGNLLVGKTATGLNTAGTEFTTTGQVYATSSNVIAGYFNRQGATGTTNLVGFRVANSDAGTIQSSAGGTPAFAAASDERLKENITEHESELANVMALRPVRWDWRDKNRGAGEGFVAQELEQTAWADLVSEGEDGYKMVSGLGAVETRLIKALQEQQVMIEELKAEIAALKGA